jgi:hypothetical protein
MTLQEIRAVAESRGMKVGKSKKDELIRAIQRNEGNTECFGSKHAMNCGQNNCLWRDDCVKMWQ